MDDVSYAKSHASSGAQVGEGRHLANNASAVIKRSAEVSESIGQMLQTAFGLAERIETIVNRVAGTEPPEPAAGTNRGTPEKAPREPQSLIDVLFVAVDGLDPQVNALRAPLARCTRALNRLETTLS